MKYLNGESLVVFLAASIPLSWWRWLGHKEIIDEEVPYFSRSRQQVYPFKEERITVEGKTSTHVFSTPAPSNSWDIWFIYEEKMMSWTHFGTSNQDIPQKHPDISSPKDHHCLSAGLCKYACMAGGGAGGLVFLVCRSQLGSVGVNWLSCGKDGIFSKFKMSNCTISREKPLV